MAVKSELRGTLLCETREWEVSRNRRAILPLIKAFEKKRERAVRRARLYGQTRRVAAAAQSVDAA